MVLDPRREVNLPSQLILHLERITTEVIRNDGQVAIGGELVGKKLAVVPDAEDIREKEDGLFGSRCGFGGCYVGGYWNSGNVLVLQQVFYHSD